MFIGKLIANGFLREEAGDGGANGGGPVSLMAGAGNNAGGDGAGNGDGDGGEGDGGNSGGDGGSGAPGAGAVLRYDLGDEAAMTAWREALGMNKEFAGDEFLPAAPEGVWDAEAVEVLGRKAWELGVPKEAFAGIVHEFATRSAEAQRAADAAEAERVAAVKAELEGLWGDGYGAHVRSAVSALEMLAKMTGVSGEEVRAVVDDPVIGTNPVMIRLLAQMGAMMQDEPAKGLNMPGGAAAGGKAEAERMMNDPSHPLHEAFMNPNHANHRYADEQYNRLMGF